MEKSYSESYAAAGVDITAGYRSGELMKQYVARTMNEHCIGGLGGFGGLFELDCTGYKHPVLISGTDGVGTKLKIAMIMDKHDTIGIDCVAMCVNDVICAGAKPLVFLDYIACGRNIPEKIAEIVKGVAEGCVQADCSLVGGETAEHPGMMPEDEYDLAGFTVGVVDKEKILNNETMKPGDVIIALPSTGVHSNGFSLVRKIFDIDANPDVLHTKPEELGGKTLGEALLAERYPLPPQPAFPFVPVQRLDQRFPGPVLPVLPVEQVEAGIAETELPRRSVIRDAQVVVQPYARRPA